MKSLIFFLFLLSTISYCQTCEQRLNTVIKGFNEFHDCNQRAEMQRLSSIATSVIEECNFYYAQNQDRFLTAKKHVEDEYARLNCNNKSTASQTNVCTAPTPPNTQQQIQNLTGIINQYKGSPIEFAAKNTEGNSNISNDSKNKLMKSLEQDAINIENFDEDEINKLLDVKAEKTTKNKKLKCSEITTSGKDQKGKECIFDENNTCDLYLAWNLKYVGNIQYIHNQYTEGKTKDTVCYQQYEFTYERINKSKEKNSEHIEIECLVENGAILFPISLYTQQGNNWFTPSISGKMYQCFDSKDEKFSSTTIYSKVGQEPVIKFAKSSFSPEDSPKCLTYKRPIIPKKVNFNISNKDGVEINLVIEPTEEVFNCLRKENYSYYVYATIVNNNNYPVFLKGPNIKLTALKTDNNNDNAYLFVGWLPSNFGKEGTKIDSKKTVITPKKLTETLEYYCTKEPRLINIDWEKGFIKKMTE